MTNSHRLLFFSAFCLFHSLTNIFKHLLCSWPFGRWWGKYPFPDGMPQTRIQVLNAVRDKTYGRKPNLDLRSLESFPWGSDT